MVRRKGKSRAKAISLNKEWWLRGGKDITLHREALLSKQQDKCAISGVDLDTGCLDHCHDTGNCRGVLLSEVNMLEGRFLKLFRKLKLDAKYGLTFPEFLINMGTYLQRDTSENMLHYKYMDDFRKKIKRWRKDTLVLRLNKDFNISVEGKELVAELVQMYMQAWVDEKEKDK